MRDVNGVLTKYTLAEWLYAAPETVMQYVRDGRLQVYRPGRNPVCLLEDVITFIIANPEQLKKPSPEPSLAKTSKARSPRV
jgi:hypothetical protein